MAEQKRRTQTNIFQTLIETQSRDEQLDLGVADPEYECEGSGSSELESEVAASTSRSKLKSDLDLKIENHKNSTFFF